MPLFDSSGLSQLRLTADYVDVADDCTAEKTKIKRKRERLGAAHVGAGASVDLDGFTFFDEKWNVDRFAGLEFCRFGDVTGGISAEGFGWFDYFYAA